MKTTGFIKNTDLVNNMNLVQRSTTFAKSESISLLKSNPNK